MFEDFKRFGLAIFVVFDAQVHERLVLRIGWKRILVKKRLGGSLAGGSADRGPDGDGSTDAAGSGTWDSSGDGIGGRNTPGVRVYRERGKRGDGKKPNPTGRGSRERAGLAHSGSESLGGLYRIIRPGPAKLDTDQLFSRA